MPLKINVPYAEKDLAKEKGAFWDKENKTWFIPDHINLFSKWIDTEKVSLIAKVPFWLGVTQKTCWKCNNITEVIAFVSNNFLIYDYSDDDSDIKEWFFQDYFSFFSSPNYIDKEVLDIVCSRYPFFKLGFSKTVNGVYFTLKVYRYFNVKVYHFNIKSKLVLSFLEVPPKRIKRALLFW